MVIERCSVGFAGENGILHIVDVEAASAFETAARALAKFQTHPWLKTELSLHFDRRHRLGSRRRPGVDSKGASTTDSRRFVVGTMAGTWRGTLAGVPITVTLTQPAAGLISGTWSQSIGSGILDPATINKIDAAGNVTMRFKVSQGSFNDFTITGTLDQTGARFVGVANGSGFNGSPFVMTK